MIDVAITERVSRYTQKVTANHTKLVAVMAATLFANRR